MNRMRHRLFCHLPKLVRRLLGLVRTLLDLRIRPLEVKCQVKIVGITALGDKVADEGAIGAGALKVDLESTERLSSV